MKIGQDVPLSVPFKQHEFTSLFALSIVALRQEMEIEVEVNSKKILGKETVALKIELIWIFQNFQRIS